MIEMLGFDGLYSWWKSGKGITDTFKSVGASSIAMLCSSITFEAATSDEKLSVMASTV